jgi:hypothetical protein
LKLLRYRSPPPADAAQDQIEPKNRHQLIGKPASDNIAVGTVRHFNHSNTGMLYWRLVRHGSIVENATLRKNTKGKFLNDKRFLFVCHDNARRCTAFLHSRWTLLCARRDRRRLWARSRHRAAPAEIRRGRCVHGALLRLEPADKEPRPGSSCDRGSGS